jgi:phosphotransferase system enzyme I (PtsI)
VQVLKGKGSSPGFALAPAFILKNTNLQFSSEQIFDDIHESKRWKAAHSQVIQDLSELQKKYSHYINYFYYKIFGSINNFF